MKVLYSALCGIFVLLLHCAEGVHVYQPECDSLDIAINKIRETFAQFQNLPGLGESSINCTKNPECDGFTCILGLQGQETEITLELKPCEEPPQMFVLMRDVGGGGEPFVEQTVSHGDSFLIPGLTYRQDIFVLQTKLTVKFEKVTTGINIGLSLDFVAGGVKVLSVPLLPETVIAVPDCTSTDVDDQCTHMQTLVDSLTPPHNFQCYNNPDCNGFNCTGIIETEFGFHLYTTAKLDIDSCTSPVSYIISIGPPNSPPTSVNVFKQSGNVQLDFGHEVPPGLTIDLNVTMIPYTQDIDYIRTTIEVLFCYPGVSCLRNKFIDNARVPIPPCDQPVPSPMSGSTAPTTPIPGRADECTTMTAIAEEIQSNNLFEPGAIYCYRNGPCDGVKCRLTTSHGQYDISMKLFHCDNPVRLLVTIDGNNAYHVEKDVNHDEEFDIDEISSGATLKFHIVKRESGEVELAMQLKIGSVQDEQFVYLIHDRIVPVPPCPSTPPSGSQSSTAMMTTKGMGQTTRTPKIDVTTKSPMKTRVHPNQKTTKNPKNPNKDPQTNQQSNSVSIGIGVGIAGLIAVVVIILVGVWYYRRNRVPLDHMTLMENSSAPM